MAGGGYGSTGSNGFGGYGGGQRYGMTSGASSYGAPSTGYSGNALYAPLSRPFGYRQQTMPVAPPAKSAGMVLDSAPVGGVSMGNAIGAPVIGSDQDIPPSYGPGEGPVGIGTEFSGVPDTIPSYNLGELPYQTGTPTTAAPVTSRAVPTNQTYSLASLLQGLLGNMGAGRSRFYY